MIPKRFLSNLWVLSLTLGLSWVGTSISHAEDEADGLAVEGAQPSQVGRRLFAPKRRWNETDEEIQAKKAEEKAAEKSRLEAEAAREKAAMEHVAKQAAAKGEAVPGAPQPPKEQTFSLIVNQAGFFPKTLYVKRDVPTTLFVTGATSERTCIFMDDFQVRRQIKSQKIEEIKILPSIPGKYRFYCPANDSEGTLIVKEFHG